MFTGKLGDHVVPACDRRAAVVRGCVVLQFGDKIVVSGYREWSHKLKSTDARHQCLVTQTSEKLLEISCMF